jgi:hypothetical protein
VVPCDSERGGVDDDPSFSEDVHDAQVVGIFVSYRGEM